jgi:hypothetical protein
MVSGDPWTRSEALPPTAISLASNIDGPMAMTLRKISAGLNSTVSAVLLWSVVTMIVYLGIYAWFDSSQFHVFAGDDLRSFEAAKNGTVAYNQMAISVYKFRPVTALLFGTVTRLTHCNFHGVASSGLMLHTINGFLFFYLLYGRIRVPLFVSLGMTAVAVFNRFATYLFMQDTALTIGLAIAVFLLILIVSTFFLEQPTIGRALGLAALYAVIIHTYEAYLVLALPLLLLGTFSFRSNRKAATILSAGVIFSALVNFWIKSFVLRTPVLIGTETRPIGFDVGQISSFLWSGALNLIGVNRGPTHLSLEDFPDSPVWVKIISIATALLSCALVVGTIASVASLKSREAKRAALARLAFYGSAVAVLLLSASITFRQLYYWLYPAHLAFLAFLGFATRARMAREWGFQLAMTSLLLLSITREIYLAQRHSQYFAFQADQIANNLFTTLHDTSGIATADTVLIRGDVPAKEWVFLGRTFSQFYHLPALEFVSNSPPPEQTDESRIVVDYTNTDRSFKVVRGEQVAAATTHRMNLAALQQSAATFVPSDRWSTPTRTPEFPMSKNGVDCMIEVAPVEVGIEVPPTATVLHVCFSHVYAMGDGADIEIAASTPTGPKVLLSRHVPPLTDNDFPVWRKYEFALPSQTQQVELRVFSKTDPVADWIAVRDFSFD